jgi:hypothetical protein
MLARLYLILQTGRNLSIRACSIMTLSFYFLQKVNLKILYFLFHINYFLFIFFFTFYIKSITF